MTRKSLDDLGREITIVAARSSKVSEKQKQHLRDSYNYKVKPYNKLTVTSNHYGKYNTPKGKPTPSNRINIKNTAMLNSINARTPEGIKVFIKDMSDLLFSPVVFKK